MTFYYKARNPQGDLISGTMDLADERSVAANLDKLGYSVIEIRTPSKTFSFLTRWVERFERLNQREVIIFTRQLATLIRSGMPLLPSLATIGEQTTNKKFKIVVEDIRQSVQGGSSFSQALSKHPAIFSELFVSMIQVGETGGLLDEVLDRLAVLGSRQMGIHSRIKSAMSYPVVLVVMAFLIVNFIMVGVLPKFVMIFKTSDIPLPLPTQLVLGTSWILRNFWPFLLLALVAGIFYLRRYIQTDKGKFEFHRRLLRVPVFGVLYGKIQISQFTRTLATLTRSGIPMLQALAVVEKTIGNVVIKSAISNVRTALVAGSPLAEPFKASGLFSPMVVQMISVGEKSGKMDEMLEAISDFYDPEIEDTINNLTSLLEPFLLLAMGLLVSFIALSVLLPIFNLMKVFRT